MNDINLMDNATEFESRISGPVFILLVFVIGLLTFIFWGTYAEIDQVTRAQSQIIAAQRTQLIQSRDGGTVSALLVHEGESVQKGQLLALLDKERLQASVNDSIAKVAALKITLARLQAEVYEHPLVFDDELKYFPDYIRNQTDLYNRRLKALRDSIVSLENMLKNATNELNINKKLLNTSDVSEAEVLRMQRTVFELESQIINRRNKFFEDAQMEMTKAQEELSTQTEQLHEREESLQNMEFHAPVNGVVNNVRFTTPGAVLRPGDVLMELLPTEDGLLAEAKISPASIADVKIGQAAVIKLDAWDSAIYGGINGKVRYISPDVITESSGQGVTTYYRVLVVMDKPEKHSGKTAEIKLQAGLTGQVEIKASKRTVMSYILKPVIKTLSNSLGEK